MRLLQARSPNLVKFMLAALVAGPLAASATSAAPPLPPLAADAKQVTVSGLSSGAFMAGQFGVAYSASIAGVGIVAGGPFYCAGPR
ncbi:hypothetical protein ACFSJ1_22785 [Trinickia caryophylli]|uniref:hypothetical protein n=1 Tax=Trinickia caryophylli TaxID=28094 RepID=UPI00362A02E2